MQKSKRNFLRKQKLKDDKLEAEVNQISDFVEDSVNGTISEIIEKDVEAGVVTKQTEGLKGETPETVTMVHPLEPNAIVAFATILAGKRNGIVRLNKDGGKIEEYKIGPLPGPSVVFILRLAQRTLDYVMKEGTCIWQMYDKKTREWDTLVTFSHGESGNFQATYYKAVDSL